MWFHTIIFNYLQRGVKKIYHRFADVNGVGKLIREYEGIQTIVLQQFYHLNVQNGECESFSI